MDQVSEFDCDDLENCKDPDCNSDSDSDSDLDLDLDSDSDSDSEECQPGADSKLEESSFMDDPVSQSENEDAPSSRSDNLVEPSGSDDEEADGSDEETWKRDSGGKRTKWLEIVDKHNEHCKIWLRTVLAISDSLLGQETTVWEGEVESTRSLVDKVVVVKDSWTDPLRKYTEGMILHILEQHGIEGVPTLVSEQQVKTLLRDPKRLRTTVNHSTHFLFLALPRNSSFQLRILSRLVSQPVGKLILEFSSLGELLVAFLDHIVSQ